LSTIHSFIFGQQLQCYLPNGDPRFSNITAPFTECLNLHTWAGRLWVAWRPKITSILSQKLPYSQDRWLLAGVLLHRLDVNCPP